MVNIKSDIIRPVSFGQCCEAVCQWSPSVTVKDVRCKQLLNGAIIDALRHCRRRPMFTKVNREVVYSIYCILDNQESCGEKKGDLVFEKLERRNTEITRQLQEEGDRVEMRVPAARPEQTDSDMFMML